MEDTEMFRKNSVRYKSKLQPYHTRVTIPKDVWTYIQERKLCEFQNNTTKGDVGIKLLETGVETEIELLANSKQSLSKALTAVLKLTSGIIIRKYSGVTISHRVWSEYPEVLVQVSGEGVMVVGPEHNVLSIDREFPNPDKAYQATNWTATRSTPKIPDFNNSEFAPTRAFSPIRRPSIATLLPAMFNTERGQKIHVLREDITKMRVNVIVNAANEHLRHDSGVALAISRAAGPELQRECEQYIRGHGYLQVAGVAMTAGYNLPAMFVIHVVGPRWDETYGRQCSEKLYQAFMNCLRQAANVSSIAIPAISTGVFGVPPDVVSEQMCRAVLDFCRTESSITDIYLVDVDPEIPERTARFLYNSRGVTLVTNRPGTQYDTSGAQRNLILRPNRGRLESSRIAVGESTARTSAWPANNAGNPSNDLEGRSSRAPMIRGSQYYVRASRPPPTGYGNEPRPLRTSSWDEEDEWSAGPSAPRGFTHAPPNFSSAFPLENAAYASQARVIRESGMLQTQQRPAPSPLPPPQQARASAAYRYNTTAANYYDSSLARGSAVQEGNFRYA